MRLSGLWVNHFEAAKQRPLLEGVRRQGSAIRSRCLAAVTAVIYTGRAFGYRLVIVFPDISKRKITLYIDSFVANLGATYLKVIVFIYGSD